MTHVINGVVNDVIRMISAACAYGLRMRLLLGYVYNKRQLLAGRITVWDIGGRQILLFPGTRNAHFRLRPRRVYKNFGFRPWVAFGCEKSCHVNWSNNISASLLVTRNRCTSEAKHKLGKQCTVNVKSECIQNRKPHTWRS